MKRGFIYLVNINTNQIERTFKLSTLKQDKELKEDVYRNFTSKGNYILVCGCNSEIQMSIKSNYHLYHKSNSDIEMHDKYCPYSEYYQKSVYDPGWVEDEIKGTTEATLDFPLNPHFHQETEIKDDDIIEVPKRFSYTKSIEHVGELTLAALSKKLCMYSWNRMIDKGNLPIDEFDFLRNVFGTARLINYNRKRTNGNLQQIFYNHFNDKFFNDLEKPTWYNKNSCEPEGYRFVYAYLERFTIPNNPYSEGIINIECKLAIGNNIINLYFVSHKKLLIDALVISGVLEFKEGTKSKDILNINDELLIDALNKKISKKRIVVTGLVGIRKNKKSLEFYELGFFQVNSYGLFSESSYERAFYDLLCNNRVLFYKPYTKIPEYNEYIPDFIIKNNSDRTIFGEVFGWNNNDNGYFDKKEKKRNLFKDDLKYTHKLIEWDLTINKKLSPINPILDFINNDTNNNILTL